jgi:iron complex outermembrane receptor protein
MNSERVNIGGYLEGLSYFITGGHKGTHGYRNNSYYDNLDFASKLEYEVASGTKLKFSQSWHKADYGLPGAISSADLENHDRRYSAFGDDYAKRTDYNFVGSFEQGLEEWGAVSSDFSFRRRDVYTYFIGANMGWNPILRSRIDTVGITPKYVLDNELAGFENKFITGLDFYRSDFNSNNYNINDTIQNLTAINKTTIAWYGQDSFAILPELRITGGYRYETADYDFDYIDLAVWFPNSPVDDGTKKIAHAYNIGTVFEYIKGSEAFFNYNQSYRLPAVDEYFTWGTLNLGFSEQESQNFEAGIRHRFSDKVKCGISGFWMSVDNEIYWNPTGGGGLGANENYDQTVHQGLEASIEVYMGKWGQVFANYTYTDAHFDGGCYSGEQIPMVPENKGSVGCRLFLFEKFTLNITGTFVDERHFINDQANDFCPLKRYFTLDTNLFYNMENLTLGVGVNNIFNEKYYEYGVRNAGTGAANFYPATGTNFYLEGKLKY